jgi:hypothetical protein
MLMAKKKRSTKAQKRRPAAKRASQRTSTTVGLKAVAAKGQAGGDGTALGVGVATAAATGNAAGTGRQKGVGAFGPGFQRTAFQSAAVQSTIGEVEPSFPLRAGAHMIGPPPASLDLAMTPPGASVQSGGALMAGSSATPTIYPDSPQGSVIVQNYVTINIQGDEYRRFNNNIQALITELRQSNEISGEVQDQLLSELKAGREIITAPKPQRALVDLLLLKPLKWLADKSGSAIISKLATDASGWLLKMIGAV